MKKTILVVGIIIFIVGASFLLGKTIMPETYVTTDISEYRVFENHIKKESLDMCSGLKIFPGRISDEMSDVNYYYECGNAFLDNNYFIYLECVWSEQAYQEEVQRLADIYITYEDQKQSILYEENSFTLPAYVSIYKADELGISTIEYALVDEQNRRITYIFSQLFEDIDEKIEIEKMPLDDNDMKNYNMYCFKEGKGSIYVKDE